MQMIGTIHFHNSYLLRKDCFKQYLNETVECVVMILPGPKKASPIYADVKKWLIQDYGIPSQGILG